MGEVKGLEHYTDKINSILSAARSETQQISRVCKHYDKVAYNIKRRVVGSYGHVEEVHLADVVAVHLMIHWLDQRLKTIEEQLSQITGNSSSGGSGGLSAPAEPKAPEE